MLNLSHRKFKHLIAIVKRHAHNPHTHTHDLSTHMYTQLRILGCEVWKQCYGNVQRDAMMTIAKESVIASVGILPL